jgi:hypothetical protein
VTEPGRVGPLVVVASLLAAVALLVVHGMVVPWLLAAGAGTVALLALRALVRQQRAPSMLERPPLPERYRVADDVARPVAEVVAAAEREATAGEWTAAGPYGPRLRQTTRSNSSMGFGP